MSSTRTTVLIFAGMTIVAMPCLAGTVERKDPKTGEPQIFSTTRIGEFLGRWALTDDAHPDRSGHIMLDVVNCGTDVCGIKVSDKGACLRKILTIKDNGSGKTLVEGDSLSDRYTGLLEWEDAVAKYYVAADVFAADPSGPDPKGRTLGLNGYPASQGIPQSYGSREFPISAEFKYVGPATCRVPSS